MWRCATASAAWPITPSRGPESTGGNRGRDYLPAHPRSFLLATRSRGASSPPVTAVIFCDTLLLFQDNSFAHRFLFTSQSSRGLFNDLGSHRRGTHRPQLLAHCPGLR